MQETPFVVQSSPFPAPKPFKHGLSAYTNRGCRCSDCKEANCAYQLGWAKKNRERVRVWARSYYWANNEKVAVWTKKYRENNKEKLAVRKRVQYENNKEKATATMRAYYEKNKVQKRIECYLLLGGRCEWCGSADDLEMDHVMPLLITGEKRVYLDRVPQHRRADAAVKFQLLCVPCHKQKTRIDKGWMRWAVKIAHRQLTTQDMHHMVEYATSGVDGGLR